MARQWSLSRRLAMSLATLLVATAFLQGIVSYRSLLQEADEVFDYQLRQIAEGLVMNPDARHATVLMGDVGREDGLGLLIRERGGENSAHMNVQGVFPDRIAPGFTTIASRFGDLRVFTARNGTRDVSVAQRLDGRRDFASEVALYTLWPLALLAVVALALLALLLRSTLRPISRLGEYMTHRGSHFLKPVPDPGLPVELAPLLDATNAMIDRLAVAIDQQKRFLTDAAHELRTPIAAIGLQNTLLMRADNEQERQYALAFQRDGIRRAASLVDQLLSLSRLEAREVPATLIEFDLGTELRKIVTLHAAHADSKGSVLTFHQPPARMLRADPGLLATVVGNLIGNAIQHSPPASRIDVAVAGNGQHVDVVIDDDGPGIPLHERDAALQPFHRGSNAAQGGSGLGLAIVQAASQRLGWTFVLEPSPAGGLRARVQIPSSQA